MSFGWLLSNPVLKVMESFYMGRRTEMNELVNTTEQTPIEIALGVDADGMTTAKQLYKFLELNSTNYKR